MWKTDKLADRLARETDLAYQFLLSGRPDRIQKARDGISAYRNAASVWLALDILDRTKRWINQDKGDAAAKDIAFLEQLKADSWNSDNGSSGSDRWKYKAWSARALFYAGRFKKARKRFARAVSLIKLKGLTPADRQAAYDVFAGQAEVEIYLGFPTQAIAYLDRIPVADRKGWHEWVRAFAFHQRGFVTRVSFGRATDVNDTMPGPNNWYLSSNEILQAIQGDLEPVERCDSHLLMAANFGALHRNGDPNAQQSAINGFNVFKSAPLPSTNSTWTWTKELRGRFPIRKFPADPGSHTPVAIRTWRTAYRHHFWDNLRVCGLSGSNMDDGDIDTVDDHSDDNEGGE